MNLIYSLNEALDAGELRGAAYVIKELGIKYAKWQPNTITETILLIGATNVPDPLPSFIRVINV